MLRTSLAVLVVALGSPLLAQNPPFGPEFPVGTLARADQLSWHSGVSIADSGDFVVVWDAVVGQRFDSSGQPLGDPIQVGTGSYANVRTDSAGNFVVVWQGDDGSGDGIRGRRFDGSGNPLGDEFQVNTYTTGDQVTPGVAVGAAGQFVVVWRNYGDGAVVGRLFDATGTPTGDDFPINQIPITGFFRDDVSVGADPDGHFVVTWLNDDFVEARRFDSSGTPLGDEFQVNTSGGYPWPSPSVQVAPSGHFVIVWLQTDSPFPATNVFAQRYDEAGEPQGDNFMVNEPATSYRLWPHVGMDASDNFVVVWTLESPDVMEPSPGVIGRQFFSGGDPEGSEFQVNTDTGYLFNANVAMNAAGSFVLSWENSPGPYSDISVRGRLAAVPTSTPTPTPTPPPSAPVVSSITPASGPTAGGTGLTIAGSNFDPGATATVGGASATGVSVPDGSHVLATVPALPAGTLNDVTVTNPGGLSGTLTAGWLADFLDVSQGDIFHDAVETIFRDGITAGCGPGSYCRDSSVTRAQMAVFLLKGEHGASFVPPPCQGVFGDVLCPSPFADWIEQLAAEGITGGCGGGNYCPGNPVSRAQMSALLLKAEHGAGYVPPPCTGIFGDVTCPSLFADWIERLAAEGITAGCGGGNYCPANPNTRGQMAVFLVKTFGL